MSYFKFSSSFLNGQNFFTHLITDEGYLHSHEFYEFAYVVKGKVKHCTSKNDHTYLTNNTLVVLKPNAIHAFDEQNVIGNYHRDIIVTKKYLKSVCDTISPTTFNKVSQLPPITYINLNRATLNFLENHLSYFNSVHEINTEISNSIQLFTISTIINLILTNVESSNQASYNEIYIKLLTTMNLPSVLEGGIPILLNEMNYSHGHLNRIAKAQGGKSIFAILTRHRMQYAATLLKTTDLSIGDIAASVGYNSISHFIDSFKKEIGLSPSKYKNNELLKHTKTNRFGTNEI